MYQALSSRLSLSQSLSRVSLGLSGALNRLSLGPGAGRRDSVTKVCSSAIQLKMKSRRWSAYEQHECAVLGVCYP